MTKESLKNPAVFKSVFMFYEIDTIQMLIILILIECFDCKWKSYENLYFKTVISKFGGMTILKGDKLFHFSSLYLFIN